MSDEKHHRPDPNKSHYALAHPHVPDQSDTGWPKGVPYIIGNEGCERFSFYGMRGILTQYAQFLILMYLTHTIVGRDVDCHHIIDVQDKASAHFQECKKLSEQAGREGTELFHFFVTGVYAMGMIGSIIADRLLGKYRTILYLSLVYCAGHFVLACAEGPIYESILHVLGSNLVHGDPGYTQGSMWGLYGGLALIAVGSGGIKPCVSAHVGDQFGAGNWFRLRAVFQYFYFIINVGSFAAIIVIPWVWNEFGASVAFGIPGILMFLATFVFWLGRNKFVHVLPNPGGRLGFLDTVSSVVLFFTVGNLFFTAAYWDLDWYWCLLVSAGFLFLGGGLFAWRQSIEQDDGFLAVLSYSVMRRLLGPRREPEAVVAGMHGASATVPTVEKSKDELIAETTTDVSPEIAKRRIKLIESKLFGPAVRKFGIEAVEGPVAVLRIMTVFLSVSLFWACFDQHGSSWILQAGKMDLYLGDWPIFGRVTLFPSQTPAVNPILVMILIPILTLGVYPLIEKIGIRVTALRRMTVGMFITVFSFVAIALIQAAIDEQGVGKVSWWWQVIPYAIITTAEVLVSVTGLEFAYTQAPKRMKSTIMGFWLLTVSLGNVIVALISMIEGLSTEVFFWMFSGFTLVASFVFMVTAYFYKYQDYVQGEANPEDEEEVASGPAG